MLYLVTAGGCFVAGALYEGCRRGGSVDLRAQLALITRRPDRGDAPQQQRATTGTMW